MKKKEIIKEITKREFEHYNNYLTNNNFPMLNSYSSSIYLVNDFAVNNKDLLNTLIQSEIEKDIDKIMYFKKQTDSKIKKINSIIFKRYLKKENINYYNYSFSNNFFDISFLLKTLNKMHAFIFICDFVYLVVELNIKKYLKTKDISDIVLEDSHLEHWPHKLNTTSIYLKDGIEDYLLKDIDLDESNINKKIKHIKSLIIKFVPLTLKLRTLNLKENEIYSNLNNCNLLTMSKKLKEQISSVFDIEKEIFILKNEIIIYNKNI